MSDKSFGDHVNKNIVKNPLLSTAVTGLSIEDLTHNAVLLPAAPTQPLITSSDSQIGTQAQTLGHPDNELANTASGDSNFNIPLSQYSTTIIQSTSNVQPSTQSDLASDDFRSTQSKALPKSEDDFDVNEYFARLQGTRYVSAPLNSQIGDQNTNLAAEENLEEINLNDDKPETHQSITADIAQNFSQLPTVLPHMASAVFSSFSNMLSLKSREQTPDEGKVQSVTEADTVPLMSVENVIKEIAPPPKEMAVSGTSNYRITTKKKYAQIPGLSSGETQSIAYNPVDQTVPSYFVPSEDSSINIGELVDNTRQVDDNKNEQAKQSASANNYSIFNPIDNAMTTTATKIEQIKPAGIDSFTAHNPSNIVGDVKDVVNDFQPIPLLPAKDSEINFPDNQLVMQTNVIPPPPMFSTQRRDSQTTGKAVLPPSVARRIGSNHPVIKQQTIQTTKLAENIFVPTFDPIPTNDTLQSVYEPPKVPDPQNSMFACDNAIPSLTQAPTLPAATSFIPMSKPTQTTIGFQKPISFGAPPSNQRATNLPPQILPSVPSSTPAIFTPPTLLPSTTASSAVTNIFTSKEPDAPILPPMFSQSVAVTSATKLGVSSMTESQSSANVPPFYNIMSIKDDIKPKIPGTHPLPDEPKPLQIPPKSSGGVNYRMTKKRPQYYSGPIEGLGAISNNTKPVLPPIETGTFQGVLFSPEQGIQADPNVMSTPFDISQNPATVPLDISSVPTSQPSSSVFDTDSGDKNPYSYIKPQEHAQSFNTVFDLSRPTTETYNEGTKETKGFGIIGSLKSKLSSIDINKIQNTVTTFFDPAYNESKNDNSSAQETVPYQTGQFQGQGNFEIFVPNIQENPQGYSSYGNQTQNTYFQGNQYYPNQYNYYQNQDQSHTGNYQSPEVSYPNYYSYDSQNQLTYTESITQSSVFDPQGLISTNTPVRLKENVENVNLSSNKNPKSDESSDSHKDIENTASHIDAVDDAPKISQARDMLSVVEKSTISCFDNTSVSQPADIFNKNYDVDKEPTIMTAINAASKEKSSVDLFVPIKYEQQNVHSFLQPTSFHPIETSADNNKSVNVYPTKFDAKFEAQKIPKGDNLLESISKDEIPVVGVSSVPLFGLSTMITDKPKEFTGIEDTKMPSLDVTDRNASISFFENIPPIIPTDDENVSELNICETCREFNKPDEIDKELDDLTTQLIENITSPIQLSNPVEVPLTESTVVNDNDNEFDKNQFEEISHITEETIETIQVQSATELLDDVDEHLPRNYGWATQEDYDSSSINTNVLLEHDYNFKIDTSSLGFYGNNSLFFDNVPTNASDEIKAEFKHQEDIPRPIPTAPPVEDDTKSDETGGLDVQSIELDAKKDFPIYEEFVIEPSETDDDKIEYKEREKTEESQERDTFTNRVERFKKMEEVDSDDHKTIFELSSPPIGMASYFDTGNFAAETHYRKSISSPSQIRIPPGFEEEFNSMLVVTKPIHDAKTVPDTSTQTKPTQAMTFSTVQNIAPVGFNVEKNITTLVGESGDKSPEFLTFCQTKDKKKYIDAQPAILGGLVTDLDEEKDFTTPYDTKKIPEPESHVSGLPVLDRSTLLSGDLTSVFGMQSDNEHINLASGLLGATVTGDRRISNILGDPNDDLSDIPTSLIPSNLVEDTNINFFDQKTEAIQDQDATKLLECTSFRPTFDTTDLRKDTQPSITDNLTLSNLAQDKLFTTELQKQDSNVDTATDITTPIATSNLFQSKDYSVEDQSKLEISGVVDKTVKLPDFSSVFGPKTNEPKKEEQKLPDPINFFSSGDNPVDAPENINRLASYFASPPKTDHGKSFFELSQSQNHYRHDTISIQTRNDKYSDLIKDLTSPQNITAPKEPIVRHINYFTVEYNTESKEFQKGDIKTNGIELTENGINEPIESVFSKCEYCSKSLNFGKDYKFRKFMDDKNSENEKAGSNMDEAKDTSKIPVSVNFENITVHDEANEGVSMLSEGRSSPEYTQVKHHWFYRVDVEDKSIWRGFSIADSKALEMAYLSPDLSETTLVPTDGGRYDVNVMGRLRVPVYWDDKPTNVRRCSWFYKGATDARYVPYTEPVAEKLEEEYRNGMTRGEWHRRLLLPNGEVVVMHGPGVMVHFLHSSAADTFSSTPLFSFGKRVYRNPPKVRVSQDQPAKIDHLILFVHGAGEYRSRKEREESTTRPRVVRRGHDESEIEDTEPSSIDHLLLLCHGVGSACDMRFRSVEEVVEDFRATSLQLLQSHYRNSYDKGVVSRIEVLPISWHSSLHSGETGVDRRLAQITLDSIPRLRHFTNDTILDVLFYTSPVFCQTILETVCRELNRIYKLFKQRNPDFKGGVSVGGHSLGSVILYDLLCNQIPENITDLSKFQSQKTYVAGCSRMPMKYPTLEFSPDSLYALGSPIAIFECIRGVESLGMNFNLPTCKNFFNIFHPYDPIAYRIEPLVNSDLKNLKPFLIPHHKGRKRMHLELKDTMARVGADLKQKLIDSLRITWNKWKAQPNDDGQLSNVVEEEPEKDQMVDESKEEQLQDNELSTPEMLGSLNDGRRIDYVLQEAPLEMINEYIFAMSSHVGYWESEDTMLLMLREIYGAMGVQPDCTVPQQTMTVQRARGSSQDETLVLNTSDYPSTSHGGI